MTIIFTALGIQLFGNDFAQAMEEIGRCFTVHSDQIGCGSRGHTSDKKFGQPILVFFP